MRRGDRDYLVVVAGWMVLLLCAVTMVVVGKWIG
jgi:hypothetical protein